MKRRLLAAVLLLCSCSSLRADDTATVQAWLNNPDTFGFVWLPPGEFTVGPLSVPASVKVVGGVAGVISCDGKLSHYYDSRLKLRDMAGDFSRVLNVKNGPNCTIRDLLIDMNRENQGPYQGFEIAHQAGVFVENATCRLYNVVVRNSGGDGYYVYHKGIVSAAGCFSDDIFRAGFGITGKGSITHLELCTFTKSGIDVEPNSSSDVVDVTVQDCAMDEFDVALGSAGSKFVGKRIKSLKCNLFYVYCLPTATFYLEDSEFALTDAGNTAGRFKVRLPGRSTIDGCTFRNGMTAKVSNLININWVHQSFSRDQRWEMLNCLLQGPAAEGFNLTPDNVANNNFFVLNKVEINGTDKAIVYQSNKKPNVTLTEVTDDGVPVH